MLSGIHSPSNMVYFCYRLTLTLGCKMMWNRESYDLLTFIFGNLPEMVLTVASVWSDRAGLCEDCWAGQKAEKYPPHAGMESWSLSNLSVSGKWCRSDLEGDCRLASLQCCRETGGEAGVAYGNVISIFLFGEATFPYSSALEGWVLSYCKWL